MKSTKNAKPAAETTELIAVPAAESAPAPVQPEAPAKPQPKETEAEAAAKKTSTASGAIAVILRAAETLAGHEVIGKLIELKTWNDGNSFVLRLPNFKDAVDTLPHDSEAKIALTLLKNTRNAVTSITGDARQTWVFHVNSGSFALYSKFKG